MQTEDQLLTLQDWARAYRDGARVSDLLAARLKRVRAESPAVVWLFQVPEAAVLEQAAALDARLQACEGAPQIQALLDEMPLFGVPFAVKDNIDAAPWPTTAACPEHAVVPEECATVVRRLRQAGAVLIGKTNLDQFATGLVGTRSPHGAPASVFDPQRISGGSSSGSAVAVARGDVAFSLGTDTAGSGRVPAGFNCLVGLKPTPGRVSTAGVLPACRSLDCVSIFAHTAADAAAVLRVMEGPDEQDDYSAFVAGPARLGAQRGLATGQPLRMAVPARPSLSTQEGYEEAWPVALQQARDLGVEMEEIDFSELLEIARLLYEGPWVAERQAVLEKRLAQAPQTVDPTVAAVVRKAEGQRAVDAFRAQYRLKSLARRAQALWSRFDALMVPTAPRHPTFAEVAADPIGVNAQLGTYTNFVNLLGWSALALPAGTTPTGLPFGVTFIGPAAADAALAQWGLQWEAATAAADSASVAAAVGTATRSTGASGSESTPNHAWPATEACLPVAVVGAHLSGLPLNGQLTERRATMLSRTRTAPRYRLHALPGTVPPKPGLQKVPAGATGSAIEVEVWNLPLSEVGSFLALIPPPLGLGSIELEDGRTVHGFLCEAHALQGAPDVSHHGGWRAYMAWLRTTAGAPQPS